MGNAHFIEELGTGETLATFTGACVPSRGDEFHFAGIDDGDDLIRFRVESVAWVMRDGEAWARVFVDRIEP